MASFFVKEAKLSTTMDDTQMDPQAPAMDAPAPEAEMPAEGGEMAA